MIRAVAESVAFFLVPFLAFAIYLSARRRNPVAMDSWSASTAATLSLAGLAFAALAIFLFGIYEDRPTGAYVPSHVEHGRLVPGHFE